MAKDGEVHIPSPPSCGNQQDSKSQTASDKQTVHLLHAESPIVFKAENLTIERLKVGHPIKVHHLEPGIEGIAEPQKLNGKIWIRVALERKLEKYRIEGTSITDAAKDLAQESKTADDCAKPVGSGYVKNELRNQNLWPTAPRRLKY